MRLIKDESILKAHLPNVIASVKGETPLLEKLTVFLDLAENWVSSTFTSEKTFNVICGYTDDNKIKKATARLVVADAMLRAIPSLDIVLTPNGFAVVNTNNLAPASKPRVDRLVGSMLTHEDNCVAALLKELPGASQWLASEEADFFGSTLFPNLDVVDAVGNTTGSKWMRYLDISSDIRDIENAMANEFLSPELMDKLRYNNLRHTLTLEQQTVVKYIKTQVVSALKGYPPKRQALTDIVNYIRQRPEDFPEWHNSATAELFSPPIFKNKKKAPGYFF